MKPKKESPPRRRRRSKGAAWDWRQTDAWYCTPPGTKRPCNTGVRPFCELARLSAANVFEPERGMMWRVYSSKTRKTRKIPVRGEVAELVRLLLQSGPSGAGHPVFRNPQGRPWRKPTGGAYFRRIKRKVSQDLSCYSCRHTFAHRMLSGYWNGGAGCSVETLAE